MAAGHSVVVVDNLSNSNAESLRRVESITGQGVPFYKVDIRDREDLDRVFALHKFDCCIHFAGLKAEYDIYDMCRDSWNWQKKNPDGYGKS